SMRALGNAALLQRPCVYAALCSCGWVRGMPGRDVERASRIDRPHPHTERHTTPFPAEALKSANFEVLDHRVGEQRLGDLLHLLQGGLVGLPFELHLEPLALPDGDDALEAQLRQLPGDRLPLRIEDL